VEGRTIGIDIYNYEQPGRGTKDQKDEGNRSNNAAVGHSDTLDGSHRYRRHPLAVTDTPTDEPDSAQSDHPIVGPKRLQFEWTIRRVCDMSNGAGIAGGRGQKWAWLIMSPLEIIKSIWRWVKKKCTDRQTQ